MKKNTLKKFLANKKRKLTKNELFRPDTATAVPLEELNYGLNVVPAQILNFLIENLTPMKVGETKEISLEFLRPNTLLNIKKADNDAYDGQIISSGQILSSFQKRTIPGLGLYLLSVFELYKPIQDTNNVVLSQNQSQQVQPQPTVGGQPIIVNVNIQPQPNNNPPAINLSDNNPSSNKTIKSKQSIKDWILKRKAAGGTIIPLDLKKIEHLNIQCDLCGKYIFSLKKGYDGCFCMGNDKNSDIVLIKAENNKMYLEFPKNWDKDNIELFMKLFYKKLLSLSKGV